MLLNKLRLGKQLRIPGFELDVTTANVLHDCYAASRRKHYGQLLDDLTPSCREKIRFCANITSETLSLLKKKATAKKNSLKVNFFAHRLFWDSQTIHLMLEKLHRSSRTKECLSRVESTNMHSRIFEIHLGLGKSEPLITKYEEAAALL